MLQQLKLSMNAVKVKDYRIARTKSNTPQQADGASNLQRSSRQKEIQAFLPGSLLAGIKEVHHEIMFEH